MATTINIKGARVFNIKRLKSSEKEFINFQNEPLFSHVRHYYNFCKKKLAARCDRKGKCSSVFFEFLVLLFFESGEFDYSLCEMLQNQNHKQ